MQTALKWVQRQVRAHSDRDFPERTQRRVLSRGHVALVALGGLLANHAQEPGRAPEHAVATLARSRDARAIELLLNHVDVDDPDLAYLVDVAVLSFEERALMPVFTRAVVDRARLGELLGELLGYEGPDAVAAVLQGHLGEHLDPAGVLAIAGQAVVDFDLSCPSPDRGLFQQLVLLIEQFGVSAGPVARRKAQSLGLR